MTNREIALYAALRVRVDPRIPIPMHQIEFASAPERDSYTALIRDGGFLTILCELTGMEVAR